MILFVYAIDGTITLLNGPKVFSGYVIFSNSLENIYKLS